MRKNKRGLLVVLSGPSGSGKDTVLGELKEEFDDLEVSVSLTTRRKRAWEHEGTHYYFVARAQFEEKIAAGEILEYTQYNGNYYGTPKSAIDAWLARGKTVILKIEVEGAANIRAIYPECVTVFLLPPSLEVLAQRLFRRESEDAAEIARRMDIARRELAHAADYDYIVLNDQLDYAVSDFRAIIRAERQRVCRRRHMIEEVLNSAS
ncbi:MAG: guanylate kinase [Oscillospiraceae bacterium]|jgi:guanylate kinase|nr:guanylate kinase [Oscillospiraceae bacterium]